MDFSISINYHSFRLQFILFQDIFVGELEHISYKFIQNYYSNGQAVCYHDSEQIKTITMASTIMIIAQP